jgi:hypothetical protein
MNVLAGLLIHCIFLNFGMFFIFNTYWRNVEKVYLSNFLFVAQSLHISQNLSSFMRHYDWQVKLATHLVLFSLSFYQY